MAKIRVGDREVEVSPVTTSNEVLEKSGGTTAGRNLVKVKPDGSKEIVTGSISAKEGETFENVPQATYG